MASLFRNIVRIKFTKLLEARNASISFAWDALLVKEEILQELLVYFRQKVWIIESVNLIIVNITLSFRTCTGSVSLAAANLNDKEGGNLLSSSLASQILCPSPSHREKRSVIGRFTKPGVKGTL